MTMPSLIDAASPDWHAGALCAQTDPEAFYPPKGGGYHATVAKKVCMACDVRARCLEWALETEERYGVWGGTTERERRKLRKAAA